MPDSPQTAIQASPRPAPFGAVLTAMCTPFTSDGHAPDLDAVQRLATHLVDSGNDGLVVNGTTGESPTTTDAEQDAVLRAVLDAVGERAVVLAGVGTNDTAHTTELARQAEKSGAHGLLVVTPYYNKPPQEGLFRHFTTVAAATGLPLMLYDIPGRAGVPIASGTLKRLAENDRVVAVKDAKGDLFASAEVMAATDLAYYSGDDSLNLAHLTQGAVGVVSVVGHLAAGEYRTMAAAVASGDLAQAIALHHRLVPLVEAMMNRTQGAIMVKAALELQRVIPNRTVRLPLVEATETQIAQLRDDLETAGVL
jgi:4-hydroxy-tetrahydrodipicolinate synthase